MKIASFNINNVNRRLPNLLRWLRAAKPDVVCLQELKSTDADFPAAAIAKAGYGAVWRGQKTWNGVAILARKAEPVLTRTALPGDAKDTRRATSRPPSTASSSPASICRTAIRSQGRNSTISSQWFKRLRSHAAKFLKQELPVVLAGDFNVAPDRLSISIRPNRGTRTR